MSRRRHTDELLIGEWACLGIVALGPTHGFAVAADLRPDGEIGRVWSMSRPLTYRALDQLLVRGLVAAVDHEPGRAGGERTIVAITASGRRRLRRWLQTPVEHLRDLRSELLVKMVLADRAGVDITAMLADQRGIVAGLVEVLRQQAVESDDLVLAWRLSAAEAALGFLETQIASRSATTMPAGADRRAD